MVSNLKSRFSFTVQQESVSQQKMHPQDPRKSKEQWNGWGLQKYLQKLTHNNTKSNQPCDSLAAVCVVRISRVNPLLSSQCAAAGSHHPGNCFTSGLTKWRMKLENNPAPCMNDRIFWLIATRAGKLTDYHYVDELKVLCWWMHAMCRIVIAWAGGGEPAGVCVWRMGLCV